MKQPFFSIAIPTFNRSNDLKLAIKSIIRQDFNDFEIVISDNSDNNISEKVCKSFHDKRIKYSRNKSNIAFARNLYQVIKKASGIYIFLLGDDDLVLQKNTLSNISKIIKQYGYGYIRLRFIFHHDFKSFFSFADIKNVKEKKLVKNQDVHCTYKFIYDSAFSFISGVIFKNFKNITIKELEETKDDNFHMEHFWSKFLYPGCKMNGGFIDTNNIILAKWSSRGDPHIYQVVNDKIFLESAWGMIFRELNITEKDKFVKDQMIKMIPLLPSIKFYSDSRNLRLYMRRMLELNGDLYRKKTFYFFAAVAFIMPKFLWRLLRSIVHRCNIVKDAEIINNVKYLQKFLPAI